MSKKTEFQNWSEINQVEGNRFRCFEKVLEEGWHAHTLDCATFAEFADAARKEFEVKLNNLNSEFLKWQKTRPQLNRWRRENADISRESMANRNRFTRRGRLEARAGVGSVTSGDGSQGR
jgi:hypothetical protein